MKEIITIIKIDDNGNVIGTSTETRVIESKKEEKKETRGYSPYSRVFDSSCSTTWTTNPEYNRMFLKDQERYANDMLKRKGYLFLNDVYQMLGMPETKAGQVVGWIYDEKYPNGDNFVDFGIDDIRNNEFINGIENTVILDFNVDGNILELI